MFLTQRELETGDRTIKGNQTGVRLGKSAKEAGVPARNERYHVEALTHSGGTRP